MVAVLILHGRSDLDWATALANELAEHAPVRFQVADTPPKVTFGPSVVRVALWSEQSRIEGLDGTMAGLLQAEPAHGVLVRRGDCQPPAALDCSLLAHDMQASGPREAAEMLRAAIPSVVASVAQIASREHERVLSMREKRGRAADAIALGVVAAALAGGGRV